MTKKVSLVFRRLENAEFELCSLGVDGLVSKAHKRGDKSFGKFFQWKPGNGIVPLALFFVRAAKQAATGHPGPIDSENLNGFQGHLIWGGEMEKNGSIPKKHPQSTIRQSLIVNRHRWSLYLYRLFYQEGFRELGIQFDDLNSPKSGLDVKTELNKIERKEDSLPLTLRNEYDTLIFLGCMLVRREPKVRDGRKFWVYFCSRPEREVEVEVKLQSTSGTEATVTPDELNQIDAALSKNFEIAENPTTMSEGENSRQDSPTIPVCESVEAQATKPGTSKTQPSFCTKRTIGIMAALLFLVGTMLYRWLVIPNPSVLEANGNILTVFNSEGLVLWKKDFNGPIETKNCHIADLDGNGQSEIIVAFLGYEEESDGGKVLVYDGRRNLRWEQTLKEQSPFECAKSGKFAIRELYVEDYLENGTKQILVLWYDAHGWCTACAGLLDSNGAPIWNFWHPGHITNAMAGSPTKEDRKKIIFEAINNDYSDLIPGPFPDAPKSKYPHAIFMLDPLPTSYAPPFHQDFHAGFGQLKWYNLISPEPIGLERLDIIDPNQNGNYVISAWLDAGKVFYLDFNGDKTAEFPTAGTLRDVELVKIYPDENNNIPISKLLKPEKAPKETKAEPTPETEIESPTQQGTSDD
jgi:hypothetical protein